MGNFPERCGNYAAPVPDRESLTATMIESWGSGESAIRIEITICERG